MDFKPFLLREGRIETLKAMYFEKLREAIAHYEGRKNTPGQFEHVWTAIERADPTQKKVYLQWIANQFIKKHAVAEDRLKTEDLYKIHDNLVTFERVKPIIPVEERDINRYDNARLFDAVVMKYEKVQSQNEIKREEEEKIKSEIITVYKGPLGAVYIPKTWAASKFLGRGTKWCTAMETTDAHFKSYTRDRTFLFIFITPDGTKTQANLQVYDQAWYNNFNGRFQHATYCNDRDASLGIDTLARTALFAEMVKSPKWAPVCLTPIVKIGSVPLMREFFKNVPGLHQQMADDAEDVIAMETRLPPSLRQWVSVFKIAKETPL